MSEIAADEPVRRRRTHPASPAPADCAAVADLAEGFALGALEPDEAERVRRHLAACPPCDRTVAGLERTLAGLAFLAPRAVPPLDVKAQLFARIAQTREVTAENPTVADTGMELARTWAYGDLPTPTPTLPASRMERFRRLLAPTGADQWEDGRRGFGANVGPMVTATVPLVLALALIGGWAMDLRGQKQTADRELRNVRAQVATIGDLAAAPEGETYALQSDSGQRAARAVFRVNPETSEGLVKVQGLNKTDDDRPYRILCKTKRGELQPAGTLSVDEEGNGMAVVTLPPPFEQYRALYILPYGVVPNEEALAGALSAEIAPTREPVSDQTRGDPEIGGSRAVLLSSPTATPPGG